MGMFNSKKRHLVLERIRRSEKERLPETNIGPITIDWKVNFTALVALLFSVPALILQAKDYLKGSVVTLHTIDKVMINTEGQMIRFGVRMVYTNDGASGYSALLMKETMTLHIGKAKYQQWAEERGTFSVEGEKLVLKNRVDAAPFVVPAMQIVTHEAYFAPRENRLENDPWKNWIRSSQIVPMLQDAHKLGIRKIDFVFMAEGREVSGYRAGKKIVLKSTCEITLDNGLINQMKNRGWASRSCQG